MARQIWISRIVPNAEGAARFSHRHATAAEAANLAPDEHVFHHDGDELSEADAPASHLAHKQRVALRAHLLAQTGAKWRPRA